MTEQETRKGGGGKLSRSETVTVRLDPKLRYLAELAARLHRRTLSSYIEWSIKESLDSEAVRPAGYTAEQADGITIGSEAETLWDVDEADRFAKLALRYPHLLTHEEQVRWKLIRENGYLWKGSYAGTPKEWTWKVDEDSLIFQRLREHWSAFCDVADGRIGLSSSLPTWNRTAPTAPPPAAESNARGMLENARLATSATIDSRATGTRSGSPGLSDAILKSKGTGLPSGLGLASAPAAKPKPRGLLGLGDDTPT